MDNKKPNEFTELFKCYQCDCLTAPYCCIGGELCLECFDYSHFQHKKPREKFPGTFLPIKCSNADDHHNEECKHNFLKCDKAVKMSFFVVRSPPDGDCLYTSISNAMDQKISVKYLRRLVSRKQTTETYTSYMTLADNPEFAEYHNLSHLQSFDQFRHFIQLCGSEVGAAECIWGDENALQIISNEYGFNFVIFNEKGSIIQKVIPDCCWDGNNGHDGNDTEHASSESPICQKRYILLRLNGGTKGHEHYDLLKFNDKSILSQELWDILLSGGN